MEIKFTQAEIMRIGSDTHLMLKIDPSDEIRKMCDTINSTQAVYVADIKRYRQKRSNEANRYFWHLAQEIANTLTLAGATTTRDEIYIDMLKKYGQEGFVLQGLDERQREQAKAMYKYYEEAVEPFTDRVLLKVYIGSSMYNTAEMTILINGIVEECKELGIDTRTPDEINSMLALLESEEQ